MAGSIDDVGDRDRHLYSGTVGGGFDSIARVDEEVVCQGGVISRVVEGDNALLASVSPHDIDAACCAASTRLDASVIPEVYRGDGDRVVE